MFTRRGRDDLAVFSPLSDGSDMIVDSSLPIGSEKKHIVSRTDGLYSQKQEGTASNGPFSSLLSSTSKCAKLPRPQSFNNGGDLTKLISAFESRTNTGHARVFSPLQETDRPAKSTTPRTPYNLPPLGANGVSSNGMGLMSRGSENRQRTPLIAVTPSGRVTTDNVGNRYAVTGSVTGAAAGRSIPKAAVMLDKEAQTSQDDRPIRTSSSASQNVQADFIRSVVVDCLDEFEQRWRDNFNSLYAKLLWQMMELERRLERTIGMERVDYTARLTEENERLRKENERLKGLRFDKFTGSG